MLKKIFFLGAFVLPGLLQAQTFLGTFPYTEHIEKPDNAGFIIDLSANLNNRFIEQQEGITASARGNVKLFTKVGLFYQRGLSRRLSIRGSFAFGTSPYSFKYAQTLDTVLENGVSATSSKFDDYYTKRQGGIFVQPQIDIGYILGDITKTMALELRAGVGFPITLSQSSDTVTTFTGTVKDPESKSSFGYKITEAATYGSDNKYGLLVADLYLGVKWHKTYNDLLDRSSLGVQVALPIGLSNAGYSDVAYISTDGGPTFAKEKVSMGIFSIGVRYTYNFFK